jgi:hypothetical protein
LVRAMSLPCHLVDKRQRLLLIQVCVPRSRSTTALKSHRGLIG